MTWRRQGKRYAKVISRGGRWGDPKVHIAVFIVDTQHHEPLCMEGSRMETMRRTGIGMGYPLVEDSVPTTCALCLAKGVDNGAT